MEPYTTDELNAIANAITTFINEGSKEIAYQNPFTGELTVYDVPLRDSDKARLGDIRMNLLNPNYKPDVRIHDAEGCRPETEP